MAKLRIFIFALGCVAIGEAAQAATYYVSASGSDAVSCNQAQALSTPKKTLNSAVTCLTAGDTLLVRGGIYAEQLDRIIPGGTSWTSKVRIANYNGENVWMRPASGAGNVMNFSGTQKYIEIDGINLDATNVIYDAMKITDGFPGENAHHIRLQNLEILNVGRGDVNSNGVDLQTGNSATNGGGGNEFINLVVHGAGLNDGSHGFYISASNNLVERCEIYGYHGAGIQLQGNFLNATGNTFRNNRIHDPIGAVGGGNRRWGIVLGGSNSQNLIYNNLIYNISNPGDWGYGIHIYHGNSDEIYNNTIYNAASIGIFVDVDGTSDNVLRNNIAYSSGTNYHNLGVGTIAASNSVSGVNPQFVNPAGGNFQLQAGSPVIDAATAISFVTTDLTGTPRPQGTAYDIGAYEYRSAQSPQPPAPPTGVRIVSN